LTFRFLATPRAQQGGNANRFDVRIASVLPGRYAVVGAAGASYNSPGDNIDLSTDMHGRPRFMTTFGRVVRGDMQNPQTTARTIPQTHLQSLQGTRRIELCPSPDPNQHQVLIGSNGGSLQAVPANIGQR